MYCKHCGKEITDDSRYCNFCGFEQSKNHKIIFKHKPNSKQLKRFLIVFYIILLVLYILGIAEDSVTMRGISLLIALVPLGLMIIYRVIKWILVKL